VEYLEVPLTDSLHLRPTRHTPTCARKPSVVRDFALRRAVAKRSRFSSFRSRIHLQGGKRRHGDELGPRLSGSSCVFVTRSSNVAGPTPSPTDSCLGRRSRSETQRAEKSWIECPSHMRQVAGKMNTVLSQAFVTGSHSDHAQGDPP